jgi:hypothetical protein
VSKREYKRKFVRLHARTYLLIGALQRPFGDAFGIAAGVSRLKSWWHVELLKGNVTECKLSDASEYNDRNCNGEVANGSSDHIIAEEWRISE